MKFTKMHGCGNDYIYVNCFKEQVDNPEELAVKLSERRFGIGSDGLILIKPGEKAEFFMDMYNADGSRGKMCGNGIRCVGKYIYDHGLSDSTEIAVETLSGVKYLELTVKDGKAETVKVDMGAPIFAAENIPVNTASKAFKNKELAADASVVSESISVSGIEAAVTCVSMGNPHAVIFVDEITDRHVYEIGPLLEKCDVFPERANIEFVQVISPSEIRMRVWERGSGETWACGTGACASAVAAFLNGKTGDEVLVHMNGGDVVIKYDREKNTVFMTGPATEVFEGEV